MHIKEYSAHSLTIKEFLGIISPILAGLSPIATLFIQSFLAILTGSTAPVYGLRDKEPCTSKAVETSARLEAQRRSDSEALLQAVDEALIIVREKGSLKEYAACVGIVEGLRREILKRRSYEK